MSASRWLVRAACLASLAGCPAEPEPLRVRDAGARDAAVPTPRDAGAPDGDASIDAGVDAVKMDWSMWEGGTPLSPSLDEELAHRLRHVLDAIAANNAALCHDAQLPRKAYVEDYAHKDPAKQFDRGIDPAFKKALARLHRRTRGHELTFVALDVPRGIEQLPIRDRDGWRVPTWSVRGAKIRATQRTHAPGERKDLTLDIGSLIYWRGAWYIEKM